MAKYMSVTSLLLVCLIFVSPCICRNIKKRDIGDSPDATTGLPIAVTDQVNAIDGTDPQLNTIAGTDSQSVAVAGTDSQLTGVAIPGTDSQLTGAATPGTDSQLTGVATLGTDSVQPDTVPATISDTVTVSDALITDTQQVLDTGAPGTLPSDVTVPSDAGLPPDTSVPPDTSSGTQPGSVPSIITDSVPGTGTAPIVSTVIVTEAGTQLGTDPVVIPGTDTSVQTQSGTDSVVMPGTEPDMSSISQTGTAQAIMPGSTMAPVTDIQPMSLGTVPGTEPLPTDKGTEMQPGPTDMQATSGTSMPLIPIGGTVDSSIVGTEVVAAGTVSGTDAGTPATSNIEDFPFQGGFVFDSPFFSFSQIEEYFKKLERAMEKIFRDTMKDVSSDPNVFQNVTDRVVDVDGTKYKVHTTLIKGGDANNAVSIEAVSAIPADKRRKRSLF